MSAVGAKSKNFNRFRLLMEKPPFKFFKTDCLKRNPVPKAAEEDFTLEVKADNGSCAFLYLECRTEPVNSGNIKKISEQYGIALIVKAIIFNDPVRFFRGQIKGKSFV